MPDSNPRPRPIVDHDIDLEGKKAKRIRLNARLLLNGATIPLPELVSRVVEVMDDVCREEAKKVLLHDLCEGTFLMITSNHIPPGEWTSARK